MLNMRKKRFTTVAAAGAVALSALAAGSGSADAHTVSVGTYNAGLPGSVTIVLGSYHSSGAPEGSIQLIAGPGTPSAVTAFSNLTTTKPVLLVDGVNNFFAPDNFGLDPAGTFNNASNGTAGNGGGAVVRWQSVTFSGLSVGTYTYQISGMNTAVWEDWSSLTNNWTGTLQITSAAVAEPAALGLFGLGLIGLGVAARRRKTR